MSLYTWIVLNLPVYCVYKHYLQELGVVSRIRCEIIMLEIVQSNYVFLFFSQFFWK